MKRGSLKSWLPEACVRACARVCVCIIDRCAHANNKSPKETEKGERESDYVVSGCSEITKQ